MLSEPAFFVRVKSAPWPDQARVRALLQVFPGAIPGNHELRSSKCCKWRIVAAGRKISGGLRRDAYVHRQRHAEGWLAVGFASFSLHQMPLRTLARISSSVRPDVCSPLSGRRPSHFELGWASQASSASSLVCRTSSWTSCSTLCLTSVTSVWIRWTCARTAINQLWPLIPKVVMRRCQDVQQIFMDSPKKKQVYQSRTSLCIGAVGLVVRTHQLALHAAR